METKNAQIQEIDFTKQCKSEEVIEVSDSPSPVDSDINNIIFESFIPENTEITETEVIEVSSEDSMVQEEPIDLTFVRPNSLEIPPTQNTSIYTNPTRIIIQPKPELHLLNSGDPLLSGRGSKRKYEFQQNIQSIPNEQVFISDWPQCSSSSATHQNLIMPEPHHSQKPPTYSYAMVHPQQQDLSNHLTSRQQEILKMAKSIFSKRTRTLYHWMYPTASKQQIKQVVSSTWDNMAAQEKNIYVTQVLGRFGYASANLMVNPQLGQIKELPPLTGIQQFNPKASELQNAISSITNETVGIEEPCGTNVQRKKFRVSKKRIAQNLSNACQEFDDDPELSQELAQFSIMFKNQF